MIGHGNETLSIPLATARLNWRPPTENS